MLSKYTKVTKQGEFEIRGNPKIGYAIMLFVRVYIIRAVNAFISQVGLISIRYSAQRA